MNNLSNNLSFSQTQPFPSQDRFIPLQNLSFLQSQSIPFSAPNFQNFSCFDLPVGFSQLNDLNIFKKLKTSALISHQPVQTNQSSLIGPIIHSSPFLPTNVITIPITSCSAHERNISLQMPNTNILNAFHSFPSSQLFQGNQIVQPTYTNEFLNTQIAQINKQMSYSSELINFLERLSSRSSSLENSLAAVHSQSGSSPIDCSETKESSCMLSEDQQSIKTIPEETVSKKTNKKKKRSKPKNQPSVPKIETQTDMLESMVPRIEELLGFSGIDRSKLYALFLKNEMSSTKTVHRVFRNRVYYRKYFALEETPSSKE